MQEAVADFRDVVAGLAHGLPLLLLVTVFLLMQAEGVWQVAFLTEWPAFAAVVVIMATVGVGAILVSSTQQLAELLRVRDWDAACNGLSEDGDQALIDEANQFASADVPVPVLELGGACRLRAVLVIAVYQAMIFLPLALFAGLICWGISGLAVPAEVAAEWIYGDNATKGRSPT